MMYNARIAALMLGLAFSVPSSYADPPSPQRLHDMLWVWGNPEMGRPGPHTAATFAEASPAARATLLGAPNVVLAGNGLPADDTAALAVSEEVRGAQRLVWEIASDESAGGAPFTYTETIARVRRVAGQFPQLEGVLLDDMSSVQVDKGLKPEHLHAIPEALGEDHARLRVWGVLYTMNFGVPGIDEYIRELDVINLWTWHARDIPNLEANVATCEQRYPGKPIVLGLYLYDYGEGRPMPRALLAQQCETALKLAQAGRIKGIVFLTINNDAAAVDWVRDWVEEHGDLPLTAPAPKELRMTDAAQWQFLGGPWSETPEGVIQPQDAPNLHSRAFYLPESYEDVDVEFEFNGNYRETGTGSAGFILRAADANHFYYVWFPWGGQQLRAKHFWAAVAKVDGDGYMRNIAMEWVPGVPSETDRWYKVRIEAHGPRLRVWVDGRSALEVTDGAYTGGRIGLGGYGWYFFRNVRISGASSPAPEWNADATIPKHAIELPLGSKVMPSACNAPNGDVLLASENHLLRSKDKARTWSAAETLPEPLGPITDYGSAMFVTRSGKLSVMVYRADPAKGTPVPEILLAESADSGVTWSVPVASSVAPEWPAQPKSLVPYGPVHETEDGTLLRFLLGGVKEENDTFTNVITWSATHAKAFVIRSTDGGVNWSAPTEIDQPSWTGIARGTIPGSLDLTEPTAVAMGNRLLVLVRPVYSPTMWACWSEDSGATWDSAARATFPGYAQSTVRTGSGVILCAHRYPHYSVNLSRDDGLNWDAGTVIDYPVWAMGTALEVEPDVVLLTYMNARQDMPLLAQRVRVTPDRIVPLGAD